MRKPCPFCGADFIATTSRRYVGTSAVCLNCGAKGPLIEKGYNAKVVKEALEAWDKRVSDNA